ncbi:AraC family transcriptional regulator N-terminal domain-containing protein [Promicromonospora kroppenstedtii]|uniref:AraC family transcriptional regulator N-terminal domain-containing protein n=1 Tax=Promicromonospora kroppenstedtii TaxID=440482 RepID=A0ABW7XJB7_9MICO
MDLDELRELLDRRAPTGTSEPLPGVFLSRETRPGSPEASTTGTTFALIAQGTKELRLGAKTVGYGPGEYLVTSIDLPVIGRFTDASEEVPALGFGMTLTAPAIAELLLSAETAAGARAGAGTGTGATNWTAQSGRSVAAPRHGARTRTEPATEPSARAGSPAPWGTGPAGHRAVVPALVTSRAPAELVDAVGRLVRLLDRPRDLPVLGPMVQREILWLLVTGPQGDTVRQLGLADSKLTRVSGVVQWIRDNAAEPVRIDDLARRAGLSASAFHRTFRAVTGSSPLQFQKQLRLATARQILASRDTSVTQVAFDVGYESAAQFNREYRRLFGAPPGRDRARPTEQAPWPPAAADTMAVGPGAKAVGLNAEAVGLNAVVAGRGAEPARSGAEAMVARRGAKTGAT